ncbi:MAG: 50S ribosomal protein L6 [Oscillospiraceae bacterium]|nr:50S ribosomal protein L6 [Oscillospiraceae bacterium]
MSRIGKMPITIPAGVDVAIEQGNVVTVKGPKGALTLTFHPDMGIDREAELITVTRPSDKKEHKALHGLTRALLFNMVHGVSVGFTKELEINGVGYRAQKQGKQLIMNLGYSHQVIMTEPEGITVEIPAPGRLVISGYDKQKVGQFAAEVREKRPPEPYKGKGIKYSTEVIRRKEGKAGGKKK